MEKGNGASVFKRRGRHQRVLLSVRLGNAPGTPGFRAQSPEPSCPLRSQASLLHLRLVMGPVQLSSLHLC